MKKKIIWMDLLVVPVALLVLLIALLAPDTEGHASAFALGMSCGLLSVVAVLTVRGLLLRRDPEKQRREDARNDERAQHQKVLAAGWGFAGCLLASAVFALLDRYQVVTSAYSACLGILTCGMIVFAAATAILRKIG